MEFAAHLNNQIVPDHNNLHIIGMELRNLGLFLVFYAASIILCVVPHPSAPGIENVAIAFAIFVLGMLSLWLSIVVNLFPRTAAVVNAMLKHALFIMGFWLILPW